MPKRAKDPLEKVTLNIVAGDKETLASFYPTIGWGVAARQILNNFCEQLRREGESVERKEITVSVPNL